MSHVSRCRHQQSWRLSGERLGGARSAAPARPTLKTRRTSQLRTVRATFPQCVRAHRPPVPAIAPHFRSTGPVGTPLHLAALAQLDVDVSAAIPTDADVEVGQDRIEALAASLADAAEIGEQISDLARLLPAAPVRLSYASVRDAAAAALAGGTLDPYRALLAVRVLDVRTGWPALADALRAVDVRFSWDTIGPHDLLAEFRGANGAEIARALRDAGIDRDTSFAHCSPDALMRLTIALNERANA